MTPPVFQRMRTPITPPVAKPLNRPPIRVAWWRAKADLVQKNLYSCKAPSRDSAHATQYLGFLRLWIAYAEAILNDGADPSQPFMEPWPQGMSMEGTGHDPRHVHPVVRLEDFLPTPATP